MIFSVKKGCFGYGRERMVLRDVSFDVEGGEIVSVLGPNGAGKTTLLRCMMGMLSWHSGGSYIDDVDIARLPQAKLWQKIAYVPQAKSVNFSYRVEEMVLMGRGAHVGPASTPSVRDREVAWEAMRTVGIEHLSDKFGDRISGGELQMVLIARALAAEPSMLVLDEPESNLDFRNQLIVLQTMEALTREKGLCCIFNTHYPEHALKISDRSLILSRDGRSIFGRTEDIVNNENMQNVFRVDVHIQEIVKRGCSFKSVTALSIV